MEESAKRKLFQTLFVFLIIALILFMVWMVFWLKGMSSQCVKDPLTFYSEHNSREENCDLDHSHFEITCVPNNFNSGDQGFNFNIDP